MSAAVSRKLRGSDRASEVAVHPIAPHPLTRESLPAEGSTIGYTGPAYYGDEFSERTVISCPVVVDEHCLGGRYGEGFYATTCDPTLDERHQVFVLIDDDGRQTLHGGRW